MLRYHKKSKIFPVDCNIKNAIRRYLDVRVYSHRFGGEQYSFLVNELSALFERFVKTLSQQMKLSQKMKNQKGYNFTFKEKLVKYCTVLVKLYGVALIVLNILAAD